MRDHGPVLTRRDFIRGTIGLTIGTSILGVKWPHAEARTPRSSLVTIVRDEKAMDASFKVDTTILKKMLEETLTKVSGQKGSKEAWLSLVNPSDTISLVPSPAEWSPTDRSRRHLHILRRVKSSKKALRADSYTLNS